MSASSIPGIPFPDTALAEDARALAEAHSPDFLYHHVMRTYAFGMLIAQARRLELDREQLFLGAVLHDLGVTRAGLGPQRFEVEGADWALRFLLERGYPEAKAEVVWDAIALHTAMGIAHRKRPEIALVHLGAGVDVIGQGLEALPRDAVEAILAAYPRLGFKTQMLEALLDTVRANPGAGRHTFLMDAARSCIPGFSCPTFPELLAGAPFVE